MEIFGFTFHAKDMWFFGIAGALGLTWIGFHLTNAANRKTRFNQAAATFRSRVLAELKGIYPANPADQNWDIDTFQRFSKSIIEIESAATEFSFFVTCKRAFKTATQEYCDCCKRISFEECAGWYMDNPDIKEAGEIGPIEKFEHLVKTLLSFAEEK